MGCVSSKASVISSESFRSSQLNSPAHLRAESSPVQHRARSPRYGELQGPQPSRLMQYQQALVGVARWPDPHFNQDDVPQQMEYGQSFYNKSRALGAEIATANIGSFHALWNEAREWRGSRAGLDADKFLSPRNPNAYRQYATPLAEQYDYIKYKFAHRKDGEMERGADFLPKQQVFRFSGEIDGERIPLTRLSISTDHHANRMAEPYVGLRNRRLRDLGEPNLMSHTSAEYVPQIMQHVETLYAQATDATVSDARALKTLAEIHWWMAHAMPDKRGSAAKTELCVRSIAQARGMDLAPMKHGIVPDLEALTLPLKDFVKKYEGFLERI
ncbi:MULTISPECIES: XopAH/AvrB family type III secretion system effector [unclassified Pseudomonas]|uniref:XopAH/AvrB family type III secretion system effector n=1 Tax=unclassified Pseudomonas TaxID=196821 RepID=UPI002AC96A22|nr:MULTISPECIES: XopAH/AvrB family type III secretion system effector [unclassified Pseudomonas]MEB0046712.1 XopAH/AvrB family type III secretion system effector [Pseudomonas sp. Dout3]MEB0098594.1 XopAH/AvrB family type III secretion system effector [Pseudomonas sp. DC1.2]WPX56633.1 XopAH/AvrB family type III secretion system effector [Pseudomonas sp. DC1.2]